MNRRDDSAPLAAGTAPQIMGVERPGAAAGGAESALNGAPTDGPSERVDEPPKKRIKLAALDDVSLLRKRILDHKLLRIKHYRDRFTEQLSELYFLQAGGNMMDYVAWRKRPPTSQLAAFLEARRPVAGQIAAAAPPAAPAAPAAPLTSAAPQEVVDKAKKEAEVATRVADLVRAGLWSERRLPRVLEPPRPKSHWDYLLEEMAWLAQDFAHERKWKKQAAKKCARAVQKYFQDKAVAAQKAEKAQELQLRKIASFAAKEIRTFWANVEKIVEWKRARRVERVRKEALDEQLSYIVDRTERYSRQLAANLQPSDSSRPPSDDEFEPRDDSDDDEETIAAAEREAEHDAAHHRAELEALQRESHLELDELLPPGYQRAHSPPTSDYQRAHSPPPSDYSGHEDSADDEDTIAEQERAERSRDAAAELDELRGDAEMDLDELMHRYSAPPPPDAADRSTDEEEPDGEDEEEDTDLSEESDDGDSLGALVEDERSEDKGDKGDGSADGEQRVEAAASLAATLQPTGTTLSETAVGTPVPRLLRHALREYQHVGLHWLATMYSRGLNGILADEMGLGKTIQTIALLAHLAVDRRDWGPHLVIAPTSVVLNWEMEFKKWCPAFKLLTYYGTIKERKLKRVGWTKAHSFHVCITSYKLAVQDHQSFRRKRWKYLILDEAQNIKNFKSQRWQMLLNFQTERRLLLTGTPLQNSLLELWSLMHFLMPDVFASHSEFREWFNPLTGLAEGGERSGESQRLVRRLHEVLRPFLLRRLKADVERQMPRKYEHVLLCRLSKRQRFLYDDFMARAKTRETLATGNLLSVINVLMQLRKVCNHPDLFEPRPVASPLQLTPLRYCVPALALCAGCERRVQLAARLGGDLASLETSGADAFAAHRARHLAPPRRLFEEIDDAAYAEPPRPPRAALRLRLHLRLVPRAPSALPPGAAPPVAPATAPPLPPPAPAPAPTAPLSASAARLQARRRACLRRMATANERRCWRLPLLGEDLRRSVYCPPPQPPAALAPGDIARFVDRLYDTIDRFSVCCLGVRASAVQPVAGRGASDWRWRVARAEAGAAAEAARALLRDLHASASRQAVAFPHPRLLQYDCGKLQTLDGLLRRLKAGGHRVLIFTQMTRVLDVLEAFLSMHGHAYLRLDGTTRVDRRQPLVDRFNADRRVFAFILSTRSGGVGLNLTGADAVVFYDSDWNPTMDAQAQDRCHRIGQTRDVHVYRLVTAATVEENILRKAEQKRALGHLAIDGGHFTTSYLRGATVRDLFGADAPPAPPALTAAPPAPPASTAPCDLENALAAAEDEADAAAARRARTEQQAELAEFDETVPLPDDDSSEAQAHAQKRPADELTQLMGQLTPIEKYAMRVVETSETATEAERAALEQMQRQLREWEQARRALRDESPPAERAPEPELTYCREDARTQVWLSGVGPEAERMPMWCPPTPPSSEGEAYCERWARALYRPGAAADALLPPVQRRERAPRSPRRAPRAPSRAAHALASLFGARARPRLRLAPAPHRDTPQPEWTPCEDAALRHALRHQQMLAESHAALAPNWEWVADSVNDVSRSFRSARPCRDRHDALADPERARRKQKKPPAARRRADDDAPRPPLHAMDAKRDRADRRRQTLKRRLEDSAYPSSKHAALMADHGVDLDAPLTPVEVAARRAERIAKEKQKAGGATAPSAPAPAAPAPVAAQAAASPQRVLLAGTEARRVSAAAPAQLLYRHQALAARPALKLLQQAAGDAQPAALQLHRNLQLQHLQQMRRTLPAGVARAPAPRLLAPRHPTASHVVLAHLPPDAPSAPPERH